MVGDEVSGLRSRQTQSTRRLLLEQDCLLYLYSRRGTVTYGTVEKLLDYSRHEAVRRGLDVAW